MSEVIPAGGILGCVYCTKYMHNLCIGGKARKKDGKIVECQCKGRGHKRL